MQKTYSSGAKGKRSRNPNRRGVSMSSIEKSIYVEATIVDVDG
jgi:hypothetical protein